MKITGAGPDGSSSNDDTVIWRLTWHSVVHQPPVHREEKPVGRGGEDGRRRLSGETMPRGNQGSMEIEMLNVCASR